MGPWPIPVNFDGKKFAARYNLNNGLNSPRLDFYVQQISGTNFLFLRDGIIIPDDPPIRDVVDPPGPTITSQINIEPGLTANMKSILLRLANGR